MCFELLICSQVKRNQVWISKVEQGRAERRAGHNVWTAFGRSHLAHLVAESGPEERPRYLRLGVGGRYSQPLSLEGELGAAYPPGSDPLSTDGSSYDTRFPVAVSTLERPVRVTGGAEPYPSSTSDVWVRPVHAIAFDPVEHSLTYLFRLSGSAGDLAYPPFLSVPLTEIGLSLSGSDEADPFGNTVAYFGFPALNVTSLTEALTVEWKVRL